MHAATLSPALLQHLESQPGGWGHGAQVILKVQHCDVQRLMGSDLDNMARVARCLRGILPFDVMPVRGRAGAVCLRVSAVWLQAPGKCWSVGWMLLRVRTLCAGKVVRAARAETAWSWLCCGLQALVLVQQQQRAGRTQLQIAAALQPAC